MDYSFILALSSIALTFVSVVTGFFLQLEKRKIQKLEDKIEVLDSDKTNLKRRLGNALNVIEGYHQIENYMAQKSDTSVKQYRTQIRAEADVCEIDFYTPSKVREQRSTLDA